MKLLISACLLGEPCRYDGQGKQYPGIEQLKDKFELIPVCPEVMGGLETPRPSAERRDYRVVNIAGEDVTDAFTLGAESVLYLAEENDCHVALLKEKSPSCGSGIIYDGTFTRTLVDGWGVTAQLLREQGLSVYGESQIEKLLEDYYE